jgi:chromosome segregation ATPase
MRRTLLTAVAVFIGGILAAQQPPAQKPPEQKPPQSAAEAARKAQEQKKSAPKAKRSFSTDDVASLRGKASSVGAEASAPAEGEKPAGTSSGDDEAAWRAKFTEARGKLAQAEKELDILQRELNLMSQQYYSDPTKAMQEQYERKEINEQRAKIDAKQKEIQQLKQAISDMEDELRKAGKPIGWSRG